MVAERRIAEGKAREIEFKNEREEGRYTLTEDAQREVDSILIAIKTNFYSIPESVINGIMTSSDRDEAKQILLDSLEYHMHNIANDDFGEDNGTLN